MENPAARKLVKKLALEDKELIEKHMKGKQAKGKKLREIINKIYPKTNISRAHFSLGEELDRYFLVESQRLQFQVHIRFEKPPNERQLKADLKKAYGEDIKVWEYQDGKVIHFSCL